MDWLPPSIDSASIKHVDAKLGCKAGRKAWMQSEGVKQKPLAALATRGFKGSLTITYFHTGIRTIIGVESFHG
ncbi:hypothetical protein, partial [Pandoraea capi]|uniref:hypothetical protein n=1 Tax=Pandoraea capi TaxID=2508286 RepID=UPI001C2DA04D